MFFKWFVVVTVFNFLPVHVFSNEGLRKKRSDDDFVPCEEGWYYFRGKCFEVSGIKDRLTWEKAKERCAEIGATLATIHSEEENDFVRTFLLLNVRYRVWIGLNDKREEGVYEWDDGSLVNYTKWRVDQPSGMRDANEDCVEIWFWPETGHVDTWNDAPCTFESPYVCQKKADDTISSPNPKYCPSEEGGGWKFNESCYHTVTATKTFDEAEQFCANNFKGHLLWIYDMMEDLYLDYILSSMNKALWVGIKMRNNIQQKWTSHWHVAYHGVIEDITDFKDGTCVLRSDYKVYKTVPCSRRYSFVCKTSKAQPPALKAPPKGSHCPTSSQDWRDLGGDFCYFVETLKSFTFNEALFDCIRRGGNLVSIHSEEERDALFPFIRYTRKDPLYIGAVRQMANEDTFMWADHTPMDFTQWRPSEPNSRKELCVNMYTHTMEWNDITCEFKSGYICSAMKVFPRTISETETTECQCKGPSLNIFGMHRCTEEYICYVRLNC